MPVYTGKPFWQRGDQVEAESTLGEAFQAGTHSMWEGIIGSQYRQAELDQAEQGYSFVGYQAGPQLPQVRRRESELTRRLTPEEGRQRLRDAGLSESLSIPEGGIREATLDILMSRKRDELRRQTILRQSHGAAGFAANIAGGFAGSLVDPTNIALAFVPIVGEARYLNLLRQAGTAYGRAGVRVGVGALEGVAGAAIVEPFNYAANVRQQADYTAYDSMVNIAGGAFFGAALHGGAGFMGDALFGTARFRADTPPPRTSTGTVDPPGARQLPEPDRLSLEREFVLSRMAEGRPVTRAQIDAMAVRTTDQATALIDTRLTELGRIAEARLTPDQIKSLESEAGELDLLVREQDAAAKAGLVSPENRLTPTERHVADERRVAIKKELEAHRQALAAGKELGELQAKLGKIDRDGDLIALADKLDPRRAEAEKFVDGLSPAITRALKEDHFIGVRPFIAQMQPETMASALRMALAQAVDGRPVDVMPAVFGDPRSLDPEAAAASAMRNSREVAGADERASEWADTVEPLPDDLEGARKLVQETESDVSRRLAAAGIEDDGDELTGLMTEARAQGKAAKAAAYCLMRTGG